MCGRFTRKENFQQLAETLGLTHLPPLEPRYNIAPSQPIACLRINPLSHETECVQLKWGLVPSWAKDPKMGHGLINARAETVADKPAFRNAFTHRRCVILADGFYEWKQEGKSKQPYYIHLKDHHPFVFAGIWEHWAPGGSSPIDSCAILTIDSNALMEDIHNRMPVILNPDHLAFWLNPTVQDVHGLTPLLQPYSSEKMEAYPVSTFVNNPSQEGARCIQPLGPAS